VIKTQSRNHYYSRACFHNLVTNQDKKGCPENLPCTKIPKKGKKMDDHLLYRRNSPYRIMNKFTILAMFAILAGATTFATIGSAVVTTAVAQTDNATMAGNMTGGNMTAGNTTEATGTVSGRTG
jgi:hypothetical protein